MAPDLSHRGRGRTWCRNRCDVAPVRRRSENDDANDHHSADETPAHRMADGCARFSHLGRTLRDRAYRERRLNSPFGGMPGHRRSEEHTSEIQSLMRNTYAVITLEKNN